MRYVTGRYNDEDVVHAGTEGRASTSSSSPSDVVSTPARRPRKDEIAKGSAVPIASLAPDASNAKLFQAAPMPNDERASPVRTATLQSYADQLAHFSSADAPLSSSLPVSSPLINDEDSDVFASGGQRANSELGHYPDLVDQRAVLKSKPGSVSPDQKRKEHRRSINPLKTPPIPEYAPSPEKATALNTPRVDANGKVKISGPMGAQPLPAGFKFGAKDSRDVPPEQSTPSSNDRREKAKSRSFWGFGRQQHSTWNCGAIALS